MYKLFVNWLEELSNEFKYIEDLDSQANKNMHSFSWEPDQISINDIIEFIQSCSDIVSSKIDSKPVTFYAWVDEMAGQLRFSVISSFQSDLPFKCNIHISPILDIAKEANLMFSSLFCEGVTSLFCEGVLKVWVNKIDNSIESKVHL